MARREQGAVCSTWAMLVKGNGGNSEKPAGRKKKEGLTGYLIRPNRCWFSGHLITGQSSGGSDVGTTTATVDTAIGMVAPFAMDSVPTGWLHCDGSEVSRDTYSLLYSKVGDTYGVGDGSTTFNLPDLQDEFIRGSSDTLAVGNKQDDEFKAHSHVNGGSGTSGGGSYGALAGSAKLATSIEGGEETRPRNVAMLYCINATAEPSSGGGEVTEKEPVVFRGVMSADQTGIAKGTWTKLNIDTIYTDDTGKKYGEDTDFDSASNRFKPSVEGWYQINAQIQTGSNNGEALCALYKNGKVDEIVKILKRLITQHRQK